MQGTNTYKLVGD